MKVFVKNNLLLISICAVVVIGIAVFVVIIAANADAMPNNVQLAGGAAAVKTTPVRVIDGKEVSAAGYVNHGNEFYYPRGIAIAVEGIVVADSLSDRIQIIGDFDTTRIGNPGNNDISFAASGGHTDGFLEDAQFNRPSDVAITEDGDIIVCDSGNNAIRRISRDVVFTIAGGRGAGYQNGKQGDAMFNNPQSVAVCNSGLIYVADTLNHCIRVIDSDGSVSLFAGTPEQPGYADGKALETMFFEPHGLFISSTGVLYVADSANHAVRRIENGVVSTVAGGVKSGEASGYTDGGFLDGKNETARFNFPRDVFVMPNGDIFVADSMNHAVRLISDGNTLTILGNGLADRFHESAENIKLAKPSSVACDGDYLYISDSLNNAVLSIPLNDTVKSRRLLRYNMLAQTGITTESPYDYNGHIRLFVNGERIRYEHGSGRNAVHPWITPDRLFVPVINMFDALGAITLLDESTGTLIVEINELQTVLELNRDYFMERNVVIMPFDELGRLFPYSFEWFPEFSVIAVSDRINADKYHA
jgi:sugar lactone lactonase YvrE